MKRCMGCMKLTLHSQVINGDRLLCGDCAKKWNQFESSKKRPAIQPIEMREEQVMEKPTLADMVATATQADWGQALMVLNAKINSLEEQLATLRKQRQTVALLAGAEEAKPEKKKVGLDPDVRQRIKELHQGGVADTEIASRLGLSEKQVHQCIALCKKHGSLA